MEAVLKTPHHAAWSGEQQTLTTENAQWQQRYRQLELERDHLVHENSVLTSRLTASEIKIAALEEKNTGLTAAHHQAQQHLNELRRQHDTMQANLEHYRTASQEQRHIEQERHAQAQQNLETRICQLQACCDQQIAAQRHLEQHCQQLTFEKEALTASLQKKENGFSVLQTQLARVEQACAQATHGQAHWREQYEMLSYRSQQEHDAGVTTQAECAMLRQEHATMQQTLEAIRHQNKNLAEEKWMLAQEKAQLQGQLQQLQSMI